MATGTHIDEQALYEAVVVQASDSNDLDVLDWIRRQSTADDGRTPQRDQPTVTDGGTPRSDCWCADADLACFEHFREGSA